MHTDAHAYVMKCPGRTLAAEQFLIGLSLFAPSTYASLLQAPDINLFCDVYMCGPMPFMTSIEGTLICLGFPANHIHYESFAF